MSRSAYHKWAAGKLSSRAAENKRLSDKIEKIHAESLDKGYRRINDDLRHNYGIHVNDKRVLRICRAVDIKSTIKYSGWIHVRTESDVEGWIHNSLVTGVPEDASE